MMRTREELNRIVQSLRDRQAGGEVVDASMEALRLRGSGLSVVETCVVLAQGMDLRLADAQELLVRLAASGEDHFG